MPLTPSNGEMATPVMVEMACAASSPEADLLEDELLPESAAWAAPLKLKLRR
jgi:hypothetical protein